MQLFDFESPSSLRLHSGQALPSPFKGEGIRGGVSPLKGEETTLLKFSPLMGEETGGGERGLMPIRQWFPDKVGEIVGGIAIREEE